MRWLTVGREWSVIGVGSALFALTLVSWTQDIHAPVVAATERAVPAAVGLGLVAFGLWIRERESSTDIARIAGGGVAGGVLFTAFTAWLLFVISLTQPLGPQQSYLLLNGLAVGTGGGALLSGQYVRLGRQQAELEGLTETLRDRNNQLSTQTAQLRAQNERLDTFASLVSHDLRNPLNVAQGRLELARETGDDENFAAIERSHARMETLINDMLALARHGQIIEKTERVELAQVAESAWKTAETPGVDLTVEGSEQFEADPDRLHQLFENLFRNVIDHGGPGVSTVRVSPVDDGFVVDDDGEGIPPDEREKVFEPRYSTATGGTGYGLSIVKGITDAHGWTVRATESPSGGARIEVGGVSTRHTSELYATTGSASR